MAAVDTQSVPSFMRTVPGSVNVPVARFPRRANPPTKSTNPREVAAKWVETFNNALFASDLETLSRSFLDDGYWKDHLALSWRFRTVQGPRSILDFLNLCARSKDGFRLQQVALDESAENRSPKVAPLDGAGETLGIEFFFTLETVRGTGKGICRLAEEQGQWKVFTLYTRVHQLRGHEEAIHQRRPKGAEHGGQAGRLNWAERRAAAANFEDGQEPTALIIGAGQAGLTAAARLKMLGIETLMVDQNERIGDNWRNRYHQLVLHDPVWYDHMPYLPFPSSWPIFTPKDKLAQFFEAYATLLELNVWTSSTVSQAQWHPDTESWTVTVVRNKADGTVETRTLHPRHVIQATGHSGKKNMPDIPGLSSFQGDRICHSSDFTGALNLTPGLDSSGGKSTKKAVVVGSCNSGHDIAQDFLEKGYEVTIVQRSTTHVLSSKALTDILLKPAYSEGGPVVEDADMLIHGLPAPVLKARHVEIFKHVTQHDAAMLKGLEEAGFKTDTGPDGAGLLFKYFQRGGGYYIDVGAAALVAEGKIRVKHGHEITEILPHGIRFDDGTELEADEIILATGYQNMRTQTRVMFGDEVADAVRDVWGLNEEGEMRTMWQDSGHAGFWFHGGNLAVCRYYSELLALQIKGLEEGLYVYGEW